MLFSVKFAVEYGRQWNLGTLQLLKLQELGLLGCEVCVDTGTSSFVSFLPSSLLSPFDLPVLLYCMYKFQKSFSLYFSWGGGGGGGGGLVFFFSVQSFLVFQTICLYESWNSFSVSFFFCFLVVVVFCFCFVSLTCRTDCKAVYPLSPWDNCTGWLGVKH